MSNERGFTLIETLIYSVIVGMVLLTFASFSMSISSVRNKVYVMSELQANARVVVELMTQKILSAKSVSLPAKGESTEQLILLMPDGTPTTTFQISDLVLQMVTEGVTSTSLNSEQVIISNLSFTNFSTGTIRDNIVIRFLASYINPSGDRDYNFSQQIETAVSLRQ